MVNHAPTWILIRGLAHESGHWGDFPARLGEALRAPVRTVDLPGTGEYRDVIAPASLGATAAFAREQMRGRGPGPYRVLAISFGGMVTLEIMRTHPAEIADAVFINTSVARLSSIPRRLRPIAWPGFARAMTLANPRERERAVTDLVINDPERRASALNQWTKIATERPVRARTVIHQLFAAAAARPPRPGAGSGLILSGLGDRLVDPSCSTALAGVSGWPLRRHPWAGHDLAWDDPEWVIESIREFIS